MDFCVLKFVKLLIKSPKLSLAHLSPTVDRDRVPAQLFDYGKWPVWVRSCWFSVTSVWDVNAVLNLFPEWCFEIESYCWDKSGVMSALERHCFDAVGWATESKIRSEKYFSNNSKNSFFIFWWPSPTWSNSGSWRFKQIKSNTPRVKKVHRRFFLHNYTKYWLIFKILSLVHSLGNLQYSDYSNPTTPETRCYTPLWNINSEN